MKIFILTVSVCAFSAVATVTANKNSPILNIKQITVADMMPGAETGSITLNNAPTLVAPSALAASSKSFGID